MTIDYRSATFLTSVPDASLAPDDNSAEVAFAGRSNAGKSSALNALTDQRALARTSKTPGRTQQINFFTLSSGQRLVDLPGYGYARVPEATRSKWAELIEWYLGSSGDVKGVVHLVDSRHPPTEHDHRMVEYLSEVGLPTLVVLTKVDKLKRMEREAAFPRAAEALGLDESQLVPFSSKTGEGRDALLAALEDLLNPSEEDS